jgi:outer membrane protein TolC
VSALTYAAEPTALDALLEAAVAHDPTIAAAAARADRASADLTTARGRLLPSLTASGGYTRNQFPGEITVPGSADAVVIQPVDQLDATFRLDVPLVDGPAIAATLAAARCRDAADDRETDDVDAALLQLVRDVHDALAARDAVDAAAAALEAQTAVAQQIDQRVGAGTATTLDALRARSDLARAEETLATARATAAAAERRVTARTGQALPAAVPARTTPAGDLDAGALDTAAVRSAEATLACRSAQVGEVAAAYAPRLAGFAQERLTNATGFVGEPAVWSAGVQASWTLVDGGSREGRLAAASAARREAEAGLTQARQAALDALADARGELIAAQSGLAAAGAREAAAREAARVAADRFGLGLATGVEVSLATRDAADAAVNLARARARHAIAVEALRVAAGQSLRGGA